MDNSHLKIFAPEARRQLMEQVERKLDFVLTERTPDLAAQEKLVATLRKSVEGEGHAHLIERVAYRSPSSSRRTGSSAISSKTPSAASGC